MRKIVFALLMSSAVTAFGQVGFPFELGVTQGSTFFDIANGGTISMASAGAGQPATATLQITNIGTTNAVLNAPPQILGSAAFTLTTTATFPLTLLPADRVSFAIKFSPSSPVGPNPVSAQFTLAYQLPGPPITTGSIGIIVSGTSPDLTVAYVFGSDGNVVSLINGGAVLFPDTLVNTTSTATIAIINHGSGQGVVSAITVNGSAFQPLGLPSLPVNVPPGSTLQFLIRYSPKQTGSNTGSVQMTLDGQSYTASLQATGIASSFTYSLVQAGGPLAIAPGQTITIPDTKVGSKTSVDVVVKNTGTAAGSVSSISFSGAGFSVTDGPALPVLLNPSDSFTMTVTFSPQQPGPASGRLRFNNDAFNLASNGLGAQFTYSYGASSANVAISSGGAVIFSGQHVGLSSSIPFTVENTGTAPGTIISIGTALGSGSTQSPDVFTVANVPALPATIAPGSSLTFNIVFSPNNTGLATSNLLIDTAVFVLSGLGSSPVPLPSYAFSGVSGSQAPFQQPPVSLKLAQPYSLPIKGVLTLTQDSGTLAPDPAVQFATGSQTAAFTIPANSTDAVFANGTKQIRLQTGSVATAITLTPSFATQAGLDLTPASAATAQFTVPRSAPQLLTATITSTASNSFTLVLTGYATTRSIANFQFQFNASSDVNLPTSKTTLDAAGASVAWFQSSQSQAFGGQFAVAIPFNVQVTSGTLTSPITKLISVSVTAANDAGTSNSLTATLP